MRNNRGISLSPYLIVVFLLALVILFIASYWVTKTSEKIMSLPAPSNTSVPVPGNTVTVESVSPPEPTPDPVAVLDAPETVLPPAEDSSKQIIYEKPLDDDILVQ